MKTIDIDAEPRVGYLYFNSRGVFNLEALLQVYEQVLDAAAAQSFKTVLIDMRDLEGDPPTTLERYEIGVHVAKLQSDPARRIRLVIVGRVPFIDPERFGETVALNRGAIGRVFTDMDEAIAWIERSQ